MTQAFPQLHEDVVEIGSVSLHIVLTGVENGSDQIRILGQYAVVQLALQHAHGHRNNDLSHRWKKGQHLRLRSTQEKRSDEIV